MELDGTSRMEGGFLKNRASRLALNHPCSKDFPFFDPFWEPPYYGKPMKVTLPACSKYRS
jgi:hypothetical protein